MILPAATILIFAKQGKEKVDRAWEHVTSWARLATIAQTSIQRQERPVGKDTKPDVSG
jgi:hypothetical protein